MNKKINKLFSAVTILAMVLMALPMQSAGAAATELFFSEYVEGSGFNKAVEIYNGTGAAVNLSTYSVELYSNGAASPSQSVTLSGTLAAGDVFVISRADADPTIVSVADALSPAVMNFNGDDAIVLRNSGTVVDSFGQVGFDPGSEWIGGGADDTLRRNVSVCSGDSNAGDAFDASVEWTSFAANTFDGLGTHTAACGGSTVNDIFLSEYIEGSSFNKAIEIYNGTGSAVDLAAGLYTLELYSNGSPTVSQSLALSGTIASGDVYVLAHPSADAAILAQADVTSGSVINFNGDDAVVLRKNGAVVDAFGQIGFDPGTQWAGGGTDDTLRRAESVCEGDTNPDDAFDASLQWVVFANNTFDGLGSHTANCAIADQAPEVDSTFPVEGATDFSTGANLTVTFSEPVDVTTSWFDLTCSVSGTVATTPSGGPTTFTLDPNIALADGETCTLTIFADQVSDQDTNDPPDNMELNFTVGFTPLDYCAADITPIYDIQGSGSAAAITGNVLTRGVVVGDFEGPITSGIQGFYLQDATGDGDATTSDGIFIFTGDTDNNLSAGDLVAVSGFARERFNQTAINGSNSNTAAVPATNIVVCGTGSVAPVDVTMPFESSTYLERFEGMMVRFPQALVISEYFNYDRFGEIVLGLPLDGETRHFTPTSVVEPGADAQARALAYSLRRITLDDGLGSSNPDFTRHPNGNAFTLDNRFRGGDTVANTVGVLGFDFSLYRIQPTGPADYTQLNPRPAAPEAVGGNVRVAAMNTLNYFLTLDTTASDSGPGPCGGNANLDCRGADSDQPDEFTRQRAKLLAALTGLNADVIGLNELENTPGVEPLADIAAGLPGYAYIDTGVIGTDAIKVGLIYRPAVVTPVGDFKLLTSAVDPRFIDTLSRPALAQTFEENATGARFTVVVNHLKSKGSACAGDPDTGDGQGNCNQTRKAAAQALVDWISTDPTGSGDADYIIMGDLNSYAQEDPIDVIIAGSDDTAGTFDDYTNLIFQYQGMYAYSYVFDGQAGYLDHALSFPSLTAQVTGAADWHINADEPDLLDYDTSFKSSTQDGFYEPNGYRSSDHDPVIVGLNLLHYDFSGFFPPVDNAPVFNIAKAGNGIPVKFSLNGDQGLDIFLSGYPLSREIACDVNAPATDVEQTVNAGGSTLGYDPALDEYTYVWKTEKSWKGTCRQLVVILKDGSIHMANFQFK